jgi:hypothetical protein
VVTSKPANGATQNKSIYNLPAAAAANFILRTDWREFILSSPEAEDMATQGCDQSADPGPE